ncbi:MAG TPA: N-acetylmuramoyl-L-alanine amidase [Gemmatimonadales bacterium]|nr:N-acetylmuramoyl-L-alanine amidase [Gemmatimonadales bacterium]
MKVCVDAGHGGNDPGAVGTTPFRLEEKKVTLDIARLLEEELEARGHWVVMTRRRDRFVALSSRAEFANRLGADRFVSIHANAAGSAAARGMEVFHFAASQTGKPMAESVLGALIKTFPEHQNRGVKEANFAVLRLTDMPAILVESEFITNPTQLQFLADPGNQALMAAAIADGIEAAR